MQDGEKNNVLRIALDDNVSVCWGGVLSQKAGDTMHGFCVTDFCLLFVNKGKLKVKIDDQPYELTKGQTILVWPNEEFSGTGPAKETLSCQWLSFRIRSARQRKTQEHIEIPRTAYASNFDRTAELFRMITDDYHAFNKPPFDDWSPLSDHSSRLLLLSLLARLKAGNDAAPSRTDTLSILAERGRDYIRTNCNRPISTSDVADSLECSSRYLRRAFQYAFSYSPSDFILSMRLVSARHYLTETRIPIKQIAKMCGFESHDYFTRVFRTNEGVTPIQYRLSHSRRYTVPDI